MGPQPARGCRARGHPSPVDMGAVDTGAEVDAGRDEPLLEARDLGGVLMRRRPLVKSTNDNHPTPAPGDTISPSGSRPIPPGLVEVLARVLARDLRRNPPTVARSAADNLVGVDAAPPNETGYVTPPQEG